MFRAVQRHPLAQVLSRALAAGCAALVLGLAVLAACPELHAKLHSPDSALPDECAVVLFASGVASAPPVALVAPPLREDRTTTPRQPQELAQPSIRYLRQPERGPPGLV